MSIYVQTLQKLFDMLPELADSHNMSGHSLAKAEIMSAYEHLDRALTLLTIKN
ncbi:hypothetical protein [Leuconostoc gasicomitatum]|uniref:hypothetical protein n=1 Tax=Leuconostoc gasicomitatum TaxID=115778 RepID=UPI000744888A|nr:hypothetical protein [Leuconostoc gasicomitatum]MBZ5953708.1 serine/threonine protein kinase [Leuconostoc gasicomitatum]MBZ5954829.1 serine/threonine protein kinase [Leuconostoc gasicomitatum]MBZ5988956.1 serine/threonine protein kinase [Leuconostoc gasicomitatum]MBZ5989735.1 serine/threonine protein kinase [Leuconostoc gasicomitatum]CUR64315.1 Uncharacterized protein LEKG_1728 [Leuconostoc gasicomitatum KG16-1]